MDQSELVTAEYCLFLIPIQDTIACFSGLLQETITYFSGLLKGTFAYHLGPLPVTGDFCLLLRSVTGYY